MLTLARKRIFLAGASGGLGTHLAATFAEAGATLVLHANTNRTVAHTLAATLAEKHQVSTSVVGGDLTTEADVARIVAETAAGGPLDAIVSCVTGFSGRPVAVADLDVTEFRRIVDIDLVAPYALTRAMLPLLRAGNAPKVLLVSSLVGLRGRPGAAHLCAAKAGLTGLTLALARELGPEGITVSCLAPGPIIGPHSGPVPSNGLVAPSEPGDVAGVALFLVSDLNSRLNGQVLVVNGGVP
jgi:gluconate 5-dehydrogenase/3-oxoacyl-[acyl-carrier protein] reductase